MANTPVVVLDDTMTSIANAIRSKTGGSATMTPGQMPAQIAGIPVGTIGIPREVSAQGVFQMPSQSFSFSLPANATDVGSYAFATAFNGSGLTSADFSSLTAVSGTNAFATAFNGSGITSVDFSSLTTVSGANAFSYAFRDCISLPSVDFSSLTTVSGANAFSNIFYNCTGLTSVNLSSLTTVSGSSAFYSAFYGCFRLTSIYFPALTPNSFGSSYTNQFLSMLGSVSGCTVHFPASTQAKIETMSGYPNFGGANTTVLFDL